MRQMMALCIIGVMSLCIAACAGGNAEETAGVETTDSQITAAEEVSSSQEELPSETEETKEPKKYSGWISDKPQALVSEPVFAFEGDIIGDDSFNSLQGACTDGKYVYLVMADRAHTGICLIYKISAETWELTDTSEVLPIGHGNDLTYDPENGRLLIIYTDDPYGKRLSIVDPDTLTVIDTVETKYELFGLTYNEKTKKYAGALQGGRNIVFFDEDLNRINSATVSYPNMVKQGLDSDDEYIYICQSDENSIICFDWSGAYAGAFYMSLQGEEAEAVFHIGDQFYMTFLQQGGGKYLAKICPIEMDRGMLE